MVFSQRKILFTVVFICMSLIVSLQLLEAWRPMEGEQWVKKDSLVLEVLPKGQLTPSGPNPCTYIPGQSTAYALECIRPLPRYTTT